MFAVTVREPGLLLQSYLIPLPGQWMINEAWTGLDWTKGRGDSGTLLINSGGKMCMTVPLLPLRNGCQGCRESAGSLV